MKNPLVQAVALVAMAFVLAIVSNGFAARDRKLVLPGYYPGATEVPRPRVEQVPAPVTASAPAVTTSSVAPAVTKTEPVTPVAPPPAPPAQAEAPKPKPQQQPARQFAPHPDTPYIEVSGDEAAALHAQGALTLDARRTAAYEEGHIAGARSFSVWESDIDEKVNKLYEERSDPREQLKPILVYCSGGDCEDSHMLAQKLWGIQFNNVYVYKDGFPDWQKRHGPIDTGTKP